MLGLGYSWYWATRGSEHPVVSTSSWPQSLMDIVNNLYPANGHKCMINVHPSILCAYHYSLRNEVHRYVCQWALIHRFVLKYRLVSLYFNMVKYNDDRRGWKWSLSDCVSRVSYNVQHWYVVKGSSNLAQEIYYPKLHANFTTARIQDSQCSFHHFCKEWMHTHHSQTHS